MIRVGLINGKSVPAEASVDSQSLTETQNKLKVVDYNFFSEFDINFVYFHSLLDHYNSKAGDLKEGQFESCQFERSGLNLVILACDHWPGLRNGKKDNLKEVG